MSGLNGDKSRFNRDRKRKIARRKRNRELRQSVATQSQPTSNSSTRKVNAE
jgi:hypothetical protein